MISSSTFSIQCFAEPFISEIEGTDRNVDRQSVSEFQMPAGEEIRKCLPELFQPAGGGTMNPGILVEVTAHLMTPPTEQTSDNI